MQFSQMTQKCGVTCFLKIPGTGVGGLIILKQAITRVPELLAANQEFELDSKFDFLYSEIFKYFRSSGRLNANLVLMGTTII